MVSASYVGGGLGRWTQNILWFLVPGRVDGGQASSVVKKCLKNVCAISYFLRRWSWRTYLFLRGILPALSSSFGWLFMLDQVWGGLKENQHSALFVWWQALVEGAVDRMEQDKCSFDPSLEADTADADISFMNENGNLLVPFKWRAKPTNGFYVVFLLLLTQKQIHFLEILICRKWRQFSTNVTCTLLCKVHSTYVQFPDPIKNSKLQ